MADIKPPPQATPPGEGERRALRGYGRQYEKSASLIYTALMSDELVWIGVADRQAGVVDDLVLGLAGRVVGHQFKSSQYPGAFGIKGLLLGAGGMLAQLAEAWSLLRRQFPQDEVEIRFITTDFPSKKDTVIRSAAGEVHSAAFVAELRREGATRTVDQWRASRWRPLIERMRSASGVDDDLSFELFFRALRLVCGNDAAVLCGDHLPTSDRGRVQQIAELLPRLISNEPQSDRWTREELLKALHWSDAIGQRRSHRFEVGAYVQRNQVTENELRRAVVDENNHGYVSLIGPPGTGKSTLLQTGMLPVPDTVIIRYLAFIPREAHGLSRAEADDFLLDVIAQLRRSGLKAAHYGDADLREKREQLEALMQEAARRFAERRIRTVIIVDGLDHISREEQPVRSLLAELPLPEAIPIGVTIILGTQYLDLDGLPPGVRNQAEEASRCVHMQPLSREAIHRLVEDAGIPADVDRDRVYEVAQGHPLATRYLTEALKACADGSARQAFLTDEFEYGGDVQRVYNSAWRKLDHDPDSRRVLAYVARADGAIDPRLIATKVPEDAVERAYRSASHLLAADPQGRWRIFHNSFRLFLLGKRELRFGREDPDYGRSIYADLAELTRRADDNDPQRWLELRYRARAEDHDAVMALIGPERFRRELAAGRNADEIQADIRFAFRSVKERRDRTGLVGLCLSLHEIGCRAQVLRNADAIVDAYLALDDIDTALAELEGEGRGRATRSYKVIDALLARDRIEDARREFEKIEPIGKLLGTERIGFVDADDDLFEWAARVHHFREPDQILAAIERLVDDDRKDAFRGSNIGDVRAMLRYNVALAVVTSNPEIDIDRLIRELTVEPAARPYLLMKAAWSAFYRGESGLAERIYRTLSLADATALSSTAKRETALLAYRLGDVENARQLYRGLDAPSLFEAEKDVGDKPVSARTDHIIAHASLAARLGERPPEPREPEHPQLRAFQRHLLTIGRLHGDARAGRRSPPYLVARAVRTVLIFLNQSKPNNADGFYGGLQVQYAAPVLGAAMVELAVAHGVPAYGAVMAEFDAVMSNTNALVCRWPEFRRRVVLRAYEHDRDAETAAPRIEAIIKASTDAGTPEEQVEEIALNARAFALIGQTARSRELLEILHGETLGYARPPRHDPQYIFWGDIFERACNADPAHRQGRVLFMTQLLTGMARTEGRDAARRLTDAVIQQAVQCTPGLGAYVAARLEDAGLVSWPRMIDALLRGLVVRRPDLALAAASAWAHMVLPYHHEIYYQESETGAFIRAAVNCAPENNLEALIDLLRQRIEAEGAYDIREQLLNVLLVALRTRGGSSTALCGSLDRWHREAPPKSEDRNSSSDPFIGVQTLGELAEMLGDDQPEYRTVAAAERLILSATFPDARIFAAAHPRLFENSRVACALARVAIATGENSYARNLLNRHRPRPEERAHWDRWRGGIKIDYYRCIVELDVAIGRSAAFDQLADDIIAGRELLWSLLIDMTEILDVVTDMAEWAAIWDLLAEQLAQFREYRFGQPTTLAPEFPRTEEDLLAHIYEQALSLKLLEPSRQARIAAALACGAPGGHGVFLALVDRLFASGVDGPAEAVGLLMAAKENPTIAARFGPAVERLLEHPDFAVSFGAAKLALEWGIKAEVQRRRLPRYYDIVFDDAERGEVFRAPERSQESWNVVDDPFAWTWPFKRPIRLLAKTTGLTVMQLRRRCHQFISEMGELDTIKLGANHALSQRVERLEMRLPFPRPSIAATIWALRRVVGELMHAGYVDTPSLALLFHELGFPAVGELIMEPAERPVGMPRANIYEVGLRDTPSAWVEAIEEDLRPLQFGEHMVLAEVTRFGRTRFRRKYTVGRVRLHGLADCELPSIEEVIDQLPVVINLSPSVTSYGHPSKHLVARFVPNGMASRRYPMPVICPHWATRLNWSPHPVNPLVYRDGAGTVVARSIWWRDGGVRDVNEEAFHGEGFLLLLTPTGVAQIKALAGEIVVETYCWRNVSPETDGDPLISNTARSPDRSIWRVSRAP